MNSKTSTKIDKTLEDTFPASDPSAGNMGSEKTVQERKRRLEEFARPSRDGESERRRPTIQLRG